MDAQLKKMLHEFEAKFEQEEISNKKFKSCFSFYK
jgi:hypothetical protein